MARRVGVANGSGPTARSAQLTIKYQTRRTPRGCDRRVVYLSYGIPPVTAAEVEIMHQHLEEIAQSFRAAAANGEVSQ